MKFFTTSGAMDTVFLGSPEVYWWPKFQALMVRKVGGFDWQTFKVNSNVVDVAQNPNNYVESQRIEAGGFKNKMNIGGQFSVHPLFYNDYMLSYTIKNDKPGETAQILKYFDEIDYLGVFN